MSASTSSQGQQFSAAATGRKTACGIVNIALRVMTPKASRSGTRGHPAEHDVYGAPRVSVSPRLRVSMSAVRPRCASHYRGIAEALPQPPDLAKQSKIQNPKSKIATLGLLLALLLTAAGCTRTFWRGRADREVAYLVAEKSNNPRWSLPPGFNLNMDPRSRFYDPTNPDHPPMPPDDPYSHVYMHHVDGKRAAPWWHINGELPSLPNPGWRQLMSEYCEMTPEGAVKLDLPGAIALSYIHYPAHRQQLETLYLSAIDVSSERFRFNTQIYPGAGLNFLRAGTLRNGVAVPGDVIGGRQVFVPRSQLTQTNGNAVGSPALIRKEFATGGTLLVNFANSFVWQLAGPHTNTTNSLINMNLVQPLLSGGGRIITLETLTLAERTLLANLRQYERWRQAWFLQVSVGAGGALGQANLARKGGGFGGTGLTGFSGQGINGLGNVAAAAGFGGIGGGGGAGGLGGGATAAVAGAAGGGSGNLLASFYGVLQQQVNIDNAQNALNLQIRTLKLLEANLAAGLIDITQVDTFRQSIETSKANLLLARIQLETLKDTFKMTTLGLPPDLPMVFEDPLITQFQLIDPRLNQLQVTISDLTDRIGDLPEEPASNQLRQVVDDLDKIRRELGGAFPSSREDLRTLESRSNPRMRLMTPGERADFVAEKQRTADRLAQLETRFMQTEADFESLRESADSADPSQVADRAVALANNISNLAQEVTLVKAQARLESVVMVPVELSTIDALNIARAHRLDWMNQRAGLVDQWRLICFNANSLRSILNLTVNGNLGTVGNNPTKFEANNGDLTLGVQFAPPLTRLLQRNNYRQALIQYQQARRTLIQFEDQVNFQLRNDMRSLRNFEINFEIQRQAVRIAIRRVDQTREALNQPPPPVQLGQVPTSLGPTAATSLLTALQALSDSQNNYMSAWLQHYDERLQLYNDLGIMRLDNRGMWIDEPLDKSLAAVEQMYPLPPELPVDWLKDVGLTPPALPRNEGIPPLGGDTTTETQRQYSTPERAQEFNIQRPSEAQPQRQPETLLPPPGVTPPPMPPTPPGGREGAINEGAADDGEEDTEGEQADDETRRQPSPPPKRGIRDWLFGKPKKAMAAAEPVHYEESRGRRPIPNAG